MSFAPCNYVIFRCFKFSNSSIFLDLDRIAFEISLLQINYKILQDDVKINFI